MGNIPTAVRPSRAATNASVAQTLPESPIRQTAPLKKNDNGRLVKLFTTKSSSQVAPTRLSFGDMRIAIGLSMQSVDSGETAMCNLNPTLAKQYSSPALEMTSTRQICDENRLLLAELYITLCRQNAFTQSGAFDLEACASFVAAWSDLALETVQKRLSSPSGIPSIFDTITCRADDAAFSWSYSATNILEPSIIVSHTNIVFGDSECVDLSHLYLANAILDFDNTVIRTPIHSCNLDGATLSNLFLDGVIIEQSSFRKTQWCHCRLSMTARRVDFSQSRFCNTHIHHTDFSNCRFSYAIFESASIADVTFQSSNQLDHLYILGKPLQLNSLLHLTRVKSLWHNVIIRHCALSNLSMSDVCIRHTRLEKVEINHAQLKDIDIHETSMSDVKFIKSNIGKLAIHSPEQGNAAIRNLKFIRSTLTQCQFSALQPMQILEVVDCQLSQVGFNGNIHYALFRNTIFNTSHFKNCTLLFGKFISTALTNVAFWNNDLQTTEFLDSCDVDLVSHENALPSMRHFLRTSFTITKETLSTLEFCRQRKRLLGSDSTQGMLLKRLCNFSQHGQLSMWRVLAASLESHRAAATNYNDVAQPILSILLKPQNLSLFGLYGNTRSHDPHIHALIMQCIEYELPRYSTLGLDIDGLYGRPWEREVAMLLAETMPSRGIDQRRRYSALIHQILGAANQGQLALSNDIRTKLSEHLLHAT